MNRRRKSSMFFVLLVGCPAFVATGGQQRQDRLSEILLKTSEQEAKEQDEQLEAEHQSELQRLERSINCKRVCCNTMLLVTSLALSVGPLVAVITRHCNKV